MKDLFGKAMLDYQTNNNPEDLITETSISYADPMSVSYLFRDYGQMPSIEQAALKLSRGKVLDVGCGAGSHSLYLQEKGIDARAIDISPAAIQTCLLRGVKNAEKMSIMDVSGKFDTILLLMNGAGMCGKLSRINEFLQKLKSLLLPGGQILLDSSDIIYMFDDDEDEIMRGESESSDAKGTLGSEYYGEVTFNITYKGESEIPFDWMYVDFNTLQSAAAANGFICELVAEGDHFDYLARLTATESD